MMVVFMVTFFKDRRMNGHVSNHAARYEGFPNEV